MPARRCKGFAAQSPSRGIFSKGDGCPILVCDGISKVVATGHRLKVDFATATIVDTVTGHELKATPLSDTALEILEAGGLVPFARKRLAARAST